MMISVIDFIFIIIESVLIAGFYGLYMEMKYKSNIITVLFFVLFFIVDSASTYLKMPSAYQMFFNLITFFILLLIFIDGTFAEKIMLSIFTNAVMMSISYLSVASISKLYNVSFVNAVSDKGIIRISVLIFSKILLFAVFFFFLNMKKNVIPELKTEEYLLITIVTLISIFIEYILRNYLLIDGRNYAVFFSTTIAMVVLNAVIYYFTIVISIKNHEKSELIKTKFQLKQQEEDYKNIEEKYKETLEIRHDVKNHILCALSLAEENNIEELKTFLKKYSNESIGSLKTFVLTKNNILNAIINSKFSEAENKNIDAKCIVDNDIDFSNDADICTVLSNLLDNAIEACERNNKPSKIALNVSKLEDEIIIVIRNTVDKNILEDNPELRTSKSDKKMHGFGISSVRKVLEKYNGTLTYELENDVFVTKVLIKNIC